MNRILIAEHHHLLRVGIVGLLQAEPGVAVVHQAVDTDTMLQGVREHRPDVILLDLHLPPAGGLEGLRRALRADAGVRVICMGLGRHGPYPRRLLEHGAAGVLTMGCTPGELAEALMSVSRGQIHVGAELARALVQSSLTGTLQPVEELSARELDVVKMLSEGRRLREISDRLCISTKTVSTYRSRVCRKLGVRNDVELTHLCLEHGLIENRYCG